MALNLYPMIFEDNYKHHIWGNVNRPEHNKVSDEEEGFSESWELSTHPNGPSVIANGDLAGKQLVNVFNENKAEILGEYADTFAEFPLLIKFLNTKTRPSVQVHPNDEQAQELEDYPYGKGELWYFLDKDQETFAVCGVKPGVTKDELKENSKNIFDYLGKYPIEKDSFFNLPPGAVHSPGEGCQFIEIQQSSDITYRIYDYDRLGKDGKPRELHLDKGIECIDLDYQPDTGDPKVLEENDHYVEAKIADQKYFEVNRVQVKDSIKESTNGGPVILIFIEGSATIEGAEDNLAVEQIETVLIPAAMDEVTIKGNCTYLKVTIPEALKAE
ncbi:class I mannose-6-phosphate isomerase [Aerococcus urinae]|uniref:type I phosphomannose isomerase catalytic subunit n=1 Tax=Aerococcus urinae TaxID=1376 RepID=UPI00254F84A9|nr:type I phosphomannose isomerase catalytic subunit [Aerococcus urinae]MDK6371083.1 class I mannose-6-phosphate isomerase [Aerococcus urinae]